LAGTGRSGLGVPGLPIEGFIESVVQEVAPFGIDFIIVEPGPTDTSLVRAAPMDVYDDTPAGAVRRAVAQGSFAIKGDAAHGRCHDFRCRQYKTDAAPYAR
jgi:NAD(P)-dependent dehydrogenase (short-subunit alcohol dehydrogenase family)